MKVVIEMDDGFRWWMDPLNDADHRQAALAVSRLNEIEIDLDTYNEYKMIAKRFYVVQEHLEHLYRHQQGMPPFQQSPYYKEEQHDNVSNNDGRQANGERPSVPTGDFAGDGQEGKSERIKFDRNDR